MTPKDFIAKWGTPGGVPGPAYALNEEQGAQSHFLDLCDLLGVPKPGSAEGYRFEEKSALIPADLSANLPSEVPGATTDKNLEPNRPPAHIPRAQAAIKSIPLRETATAIAQAAQRLNALREAWLNPPEWTARVPEVVPLGMDASPYPDRIVAKAGFEKELAKRTLTQLYNQRPAWLASAHQQLDAAVAAAYGWHDYTPAMTDDEILRRLLALNLARSAPAGA